MYLHQETQPLTNCEQAALFVTLAHNEWVEQELAGVAEDSFADWLPFIGEQALKIVGMEQPHYYDRAA